MRYLILIILLSCIPLSASAETQSNGALAHFGNKKLTAEEFARREPNLLSWAGISAGSEQLQARVEDLVLESLAATEARRSGLEEDPEIAIQLDRILKSAYLKKKMPRDEIEVNPEEIEKFYNDNREKFRNPDLATISHLLFSTKDEALKARARLGTGSFGALSANSSDPVTVRKHGSLGVIPQQSLMLPLFNAISAAGEGTISDPVQTVFGYHIVRLEKAPTPSYRPLEEVRKEIYDELIRQKQQARLTAIKSELWKKYDVSIDRSAIDALVAQNTRAKLDVDLTLAGKRPQVIGKVPDLQLISDSVDFGQVSSKPLTESLLIGNASDHPVKIDRVGSTCPCIKTSVAKKVLSPGEVTRLTFTYTPETVDDRGRVERVLFIDSDDTIRPKAFARLRFDVRKGNK